MKEGVSNVFIFYSGHGAPSVSNDKSKAEGYFVPVDAEDPNHIAIGGYSLNVFYTNLNKIPVKNQITVVLDACFSGAGLLENISPFAIDVTQMLVNSKKILVFASSTAKQASSWYRAQGHGMFSFFFLKGIHNRNADSNNNDILTATELHSYVAHKTEGVPYYSGRYNSIEQTPQLIGLDTARVIVHYKK